MKHTLIVIGWLGIRRCYLDVSRDEAIRRYLLSEEQSDINEEAGERINEFEFDDEFRAYDAYAKEAK